MILRFCVCIPTFDNPQTIVSVVNDVLSTTEYPVLVIDDGSAVPVADILRDSDVAPVLSSGRVHVLRIQKNSGKGVALKMAIDSCVGRGFTHLIAIDGDGQHHAREIAKLVKVSLINPWDLVIGQRRMDGINVPGISRFGRRFSNFWVNYQTGVRVTDSQSGFRLYPLFHVQNMKFLTKRYDFEIEILIRLIWKNVGVREVSIDVFYPEPHLRVSHFDKFTDNVRISLLNTLLVVVSLIKSQISAAKMATSLGLGVFLGCTPFYGFHTLLVAVAAFAFRLNAGLLFLGSQVSIPPLMPFLVFGSVVLGRQILGGDEMTLLSFETLKKMSVPELIALGRDQFQAWLLGSLSLGAMLGTAVGFLFYSGLVFLRRKSTTPNWNGRSRGGTIGNWIIKNVLKNLGVTAGYFCLYFIIPYFYFFAPKARRALDEYWSLVAPGESFFFRQFRVMAHLYRFGQVMMDQTIQRNRPTQLFVAKPHGLENIKQVVDRKQGAILLNAHVGSWSLAIEILNSHSLALPAKVVQYRAEQAGSTGNDDQAEQSVFAIRDLLASGTPLGLMSDRPLQGRFELVRFFGRLAPFDSTPFKLAAATGAPVIMTFGFKGEVLEYMLFASEPRVYRYEAGEDRQIACARWVQDYAVQLEEKIRLYPDQWFNFFSFWSSAPTRPDGRELSQMNHPLVNKSATTSPAETWLGV